MTQNIKEWTKSESSMTMTRQVPDWRLTCGVWVSQPTHNWHTAHLHIYSKSLIHFGRLEDEKTLKTLWSLWGPDFEPWPFEENDFNLRATLVTQRVDVEVLPVLLLALFPMWQRLSRRLSAFFSNHKNTFQICFFYFFVIWFLMFCIEFPWDVRCP